MRSRTLPAVNDVRIRRLGRVPYEPTWRDMQSFTDARDADTQDEIWLLEHDPVFTLGLAGKREHVLAPGEIPVVHIDRGGQVTYHGPGQLVVYPMLDLRRRRLGPRALVDALEQATVDALAEWGIDAHARPDAPGVYVGEKKIASIGLRVRRGASYHGLAFNVDMDLEPFTRINPCGYAGLEMTQVSELGGPKALDTVADAFLPHFTSRIDNVKRD
ncbi:MAG TPA: lipoyl(octanoyl) transferase LipB [Gammaproteobacteria bacterium]|nr:lipoyl(octanoyl) transferase LipB [Gammaproteobacteria bacterium]